MSNIILSSDDLRVQLQSSFINAKSVVLVSAYLTEKAVDWFCQNLSNEVSVSIVGRFLPADFVCGASSLGAISKALDKGWNISCMPELHAKIYLIDKTRMFVGSANFTSNGLKLHGHGNLEASVEAEINDKNLEFVDDIVDNAFSINRHILDEMQAYVNQHKETLKAERAYSEWPITVIPKDQKVWVASFPWVDLNDAAEKAESAIEHDKGIFGDENEIFLQSKVFCWLCGVLDKKENREIYFGELTAQLHCDLKDDPAPYRRDVKQLLSNLLSYCEKFAQGQIVIDRPSYSQRVRLR